jgi:hypothetical protein
VTRENLSMDDRRAPSVSADYLEGLSAVYAQVERALEGLEEPDFLRPTRCRGWMVGDLLFHMLLDGERALRAFASPAEGPETVDYVTYWKPWSAEDPDALAHARFVRLSAAAHSSQAVIAERWKDTSSAALRAAKTADPRGFVSTQGHVLSVPDFVATLVVEAAIHHLDLVVDLPSSEAPEGLPLRFVRATVEGLLERPLPSTWDDVAVALRATGREPIPAGDRGVLDSVVDRFPVFS